MISKLNIVLSLLFLLVLTGCNFLKPSKKLNHVTIENMEAFSNEDSEKEVINLKGFDSAGEPEIRIMKDGSMYAVFNFMPPESFTMRDSDFDTFDKQMQAAVGVKVIWEDREFFLIPTPNGDTAGKLKDFIENYKSRKGY